MYLFSLKANRNIKIHGRKFIFFFLEEKRFVLEFAGTAELSTQRFSFEIRKGMYTVRFVFLPGSRFDFEWFQFQI